MTMNRKGPKPGPYGKSWLQPVVFCLIIASLLIGCTATPAVPAATVTQPAPATPVVAAQPSPLPTRPATVPPPPSPTAIPATATAVPPTATQPPTATPIPTLAVLSDQFDAWCAPLSYAGTRPTSPKAVEGARQLVVKDKQMVVPIPATYCVLLVRFNQPVPAGSQLYFFDANSPFLKLALQPVEGQPDQAWATVSHNYVVNPPFWQVNYRLAVVDGNGKELWTNNVMFAKAAPKDCPFGGLPDPVTLWCTVTDPWEIEPHADATYPYPKDQLPTESK